MCARVVCNLCYSLIQIKHESQKIYGKSIQNHDDDDDDGISLRVELRVFKFKKHVNQVLKRNEQSANAFFIFLSTNAYHGFIAYNRPFSVLFQILHKLCTKRGSYTPNYFDFRFLTSLPSGDAAQNSNRNGK